jgi:hypothetical protein
MTPMQTEYIKYVLKIATIYGLLQSMLYHIVEQEDEGIKDCIEALYKLDPGQANKFKTLLNEK